MAWGSKFATASRDSTAPFGLPGRLMMMLAPRIPATARDMMARGVFFMPSARICSANPGIRRSATAIVASGVTSRGPRPVPPVVRIKSAARESATVLIKPSIHWRSSAETCVETTSQPSALQRSTRPGPERSSLVPRETESLMVRMATRVASILCG